MKYYIKIQKYYRYKILNFYTNKKPEFINKKSIIK